MTYEQVKTLKPTEFKPEVLNVEKSRTKFGSSGFRVLIFVMN
jgi:hypothetical protein